MKVAPYENFLLYGSYMITSMHENIGISIIHYVNGIENRSHEQPLSQRSIIADPASASGGTFQCM
jgi:hypothetical protein